MIPLYRENQDALQVSEITSTHFPPHLHQSLELVYVTRGTLELGIGIDLFHMETGDFGFVFPNRIHHFQVFDTGKCKAVHLLAAPSYFGSYQETMQERSPVTPVIRKEKLHPDILYAINRIREDFEAPSRKRHRSHRSGSHRSRKADALSRYEKLLEQEPADNNAIKNLVVLSHAWMQVILARSFESFQLRNRSEQQQDDLIYKTVSYVAQHFREPLTMADMAKALGVSPYALSRVFSKTFHRNFNQYLDNIRAEYAAVLLTESDESITDIYLDAGFQSQATFNRVFKANYHTTPRQYRRDQLKAMSETADDE